MRCDVNISVRERGSETLGTRTEIKNMNSLKAIVRAIEFESQRHIEALETGCETLVQETRRWDDNKGETFSMRGKENATDYRYFPNPELMPVHINAAWINEVKESLPETAREKFLRMTEKLGLSEYDSNIITGSRNLSRIFDEVSAHINKPKDVVNWIIVELLSIAKGDNKGEDDIVIDCRKFAKIIELTDAKTINRGIGKKLLVKVLEENIDPEAYVAEHKLGMISDASFLEKLADEVLSENEKAVREYKDGSEKVLGFLVGQIMRRAGGKANPQNVNEVLRKALDEK